MGNVSHASDAEVIAAWKLLNGQRPADRHDLCLLGDGLVGKPGSCKLDSYLSVDVDADRMQWVVSESQLELVIAQRGLGDQLNPPEAE